MGFPAGHGSMGRTLPAGHDMGIGNDRGQERPDGRRQACTSSSFSSPHRVFSLPLAIASGAQHLANTYKYHLTYHFLPSIPHQRHPFLLDIPYTVTTGSSASIVDPASANAAGNAPRAPAAETAV
jgi:hypothetical protein